MLKAIPAFLILSAVALAQCGYPNCFEAAQSYFSTAKYYEDIGDSVSARSYYIKAAENSAQAPIDLVQSGDYRLAGKSYELAGDSYAKIGSTALATDYYGLAREMYSSKGLSAELAALAAKLSPAPAAAPTGATPSISGNVVYSLAPAGMLGLIALFFSIGSIAYILYSNAPARPSAPRTFVRDEVKPPAEVDLDDLVVEEKPRRAEAPKSTDIERAVSARERAKDKLRRKYAFK